jgi:hypothetical protein
LQEVHDRSQSLVSIITRIGLHTTSVAANIEKWSAEANDLLEQIKRTGNIGGSRDTQLHLNRATEIVNTAAKDINKYAADLSPDLKRYQIENRVFFEMLGRAVHMQKEFSPSVEQLQHDKEALQDLLTVLKAGQDNTTSFQSTIARIPPLTGQLKKARKHASTALGEFIAELQFSLEEVRKILPVFE